jgi:putative membrane protein
MRAPRLIIPVLLATTALAVPGLAQTPARTAAPPVVTGPAPPPGGAPAEIVPPAARMPTPGSPTAGIAPPTTSMAATSTPATAIPSADVNFAKTAAQSGMAEVQMGQLAAQQAQSPQVKTFGQRMVTDHTKLADQLTAIARQKDLTLPSTLESKDSRTLARLTKRHGAAFDRAYVRTQLAAHKSAVALFQQEATQGTDPDLKQFAATALPTLRDHLQMAEAMAKSGAESPPSGGQR